MEIPLRRPCRSWSLFGDLEGSFRSTFGEHFWDTLRALLGNLFETLWGTFNFLYYFWIFSLFVFNIFGIRFWNIALFFCKSVQSNIALHQVFNICLMIAQILLVGEKIFETIFFRPVTFLSQNRQTKSQNRPKSCPKTGPKRSQNRPKSGPKENPKT